MASHAGGAANEACLSRRLHPFAVVRTLVGVTVPQVPDSDLWAAALVGDAVSFGLLFNRHRDRVFRHASRLAETRQDAEDITATAFLELWRRRSDVRLVQGSVRPWLLTAATLTSRNLTRTRRRYRRLLARLPRQADSPDPGRLLLEESMIGVDSRLRGALRLLGDVDLALFALVALEGYSIREAADTVGLRVPAAKSRLQRARVRLREALRPEDQSTFLDSAKEPS